MSNYHTRNASTWTSVSEKKPQSALGFANFPKKGEGPAIAKEKNTSRTQESLLT